MTSPRAAARLESRDRNGMTDASGLIVLVNAETEKLFGYERNELLGQEMEVLVPERTVSSTRTCGPLFCFSRSAAHGAGRDLFACAKTVEFPVEIGLNPLETEEEPLYLLHRRYTERKQAEEALRIAAITFQTQEGIMITDRGARIERVNRAFTKLTGYSADEVIGRTPALLKSGRHDQQFYQEMWEALERENYWQGELWNRRKDGEVYPVRMTISAVQASDGRVTHYVGSFADITHRKEAEAQLHRLAFYDPLTELPNRRLLLERLRQAFAASARNGQHGAILFIDLDHFKTLNDTKGHDVGDQLLTEVAVRLLACVRGDDSVARLGGDEFVVMLEDLSKQQDTAAKRAEAVAEKIRTAVAQPYAIGGHEYHSTASIGVSLFFDHMESAEEMLKRADTALYRAKAGGRNTVRFFDPSMQAALEAHAALLEALRHALALHQLKLYVQMQADSTRRIVGAEMLLRWKHPQRGLVSPVDFIPLAEESGLIVPIGLWVLETACAQLKMWAPQPLTRELQLAVNVSARQFRQPDFVAQVRRVAGADRCRSNAVDAGAHRERAARRRRVHHRDDASAEVARGPLLDGRLWNRLFVAVLPEAATARSAQDRSVLRPGYRHQSKRRGDRADHHRYVEEPPTGSAGRGGGDRGAARVPHPTWLLCLPGLSVQPAVAGRGLRVVGRAAVAREDQVGLTDFTALACLKRVLALRSGSISTE